MKTTMSGLSCCETPEVPRLKGAGELVDVYRALGDETRLRILALLREGEVCVCHIHGGLRLPQPTISRHLAYLRRAGLVLARRDGVWMHYRIATPSSPVVRRVLDAALHALSHTTVVDIDAERLRRQLAETRPS
jgi:ArsR family transcriptional regulator